MKNNIYEMLNNKEFDFDKYEKLEFNDIEKKMIKNSFRKYKDKSKVNYKKITAGFALILVVSFGLFSTEAGAKVISRFSENIEIFLGINKNIDDYKTVVNKSMTDKGVTIKLNEAVVDENTLIISTNISSDKIMQPSDFAITKTNVNINGKLIKSGGCSGGRNKIDDYTSQSVLEYDLSDLSKEELSGDLDIKIEYTSVLFWFGKQKSEVNGEWIFEFTANQEILKKDTKEIRLDEELDLPNGEKVILYKYRDNDIGQKIYGKAENLEGKDEYDINIEGTDDLGNEVKFQNIRASSKYGYIFSYINIDRNIDENARELILRTYVSPMPHNEKDRSKGYKEIGEEFVIYLK